MDSIVNRPRRTLAILLGVAFVLFMLSGIPALKDADHGTNLVLGDICWFGFVLTALVFLVFGAITLVRHFTGTGRTA